jgi:hypothetical protein
VRSLDIQCHNCPVATKYTRSHSSCRRLATCRNIASRARRRAICALPWNPSCRPSTAADVTTRRFPPPWRADKIPGGYVVRDANGQALVYIYSRDNEAEALQAKVLTKDEARRIAVNAELLGRRNGDG